MKSKYFSTEGCPSALFYVRLWFYLVVAGNHGREHFHMMSGPVPHTAASGALPGGNIQKRTRQSPVLVSTSSLLCFCFYMMTVSYGAHCSGCGDVNQLICFHKGNLLFYVDNEGKLHTLKQEVKQQQETQYALTNQKPNHQHILCNRALLIFCLYILAFRLALLNVCICSKSLVQTRT